MSTKGKGQTALTRYKISQSLQGNRTNVLSKLHEYKDLLLDPKETGLIPSIVSASLYAGISKKALLAWELTTAENSELRQILDFIRDLEEQWLRERGLMGLADSKITTLLLKAEHGVRDAPQSLTQNNTFNVSPELLAEAIEISRTANKPLTTKKAPRNKQGA